MDVMKAEAEASKRDQDLTVARTNLQLQESLMKNALTRTLDNPTLEEMPVVPTDQMQPDTEASEPILDLIDRALRNRPELQETDIDLANRQISRKAARNALLPSLALVGFYGGTGLGGEPNPAAANSSDVPRDLPGTWQNTFNNSSPDYYLGVSLNIPFRNRVAKAGPIPVRTRVSPGKPAQGATEETDSHRGSERAVCLGAVTSASWIRHQGKKSGAADFRDHEERAGSRSGLQLPKP